MGCNSFCGYVFREFCGVELQAGLMVEFQGAFGGPRLIEVIRVFRVGLGASLEGVTNGLEVIIHTALGAGAFGVKMALACACKEVRDHQG